MPTNIEWADETWNILAGCTQVSSGCTNCYAQRMATRQIGMGNANYRGSVKGGKWTGNIKLIPDALDKPRHWRKPRRIFVQSMGDLFHQGVPFEFIDKVFAVMALCPQHTFMILTKRPERMMKYLSRDGIWQRNVLPEVDKIQSPWQSPCRYLWPLPNVHLYTSIEDQATADERIPWLLKTPAVVRGLSIEPMLGPVDLRLEADAFGPRIDHVIVGGESGPGARPMHPDWVRSVRDQCVEAGVKFFFKQWGEFCDSQQMTEQTFEDVDAAVNLAGIPAETYRVGKRAAGRELDGQTWDEMPGQKEA